MKLEDISKLAAAAEAPLDYEAGAAFVAEVSMLCYDDDLNMDQEELAKRVSFAINRAEDKVYVAGVMIRKAKILPLPPGKER